MSRHSVVRSPALWILVAGIFDVVLALALPAWAQESAPAVEPQPGGLVAVLLSVPGRIVCAALVLSIVEAAKAWRDHIEPPAPSDAWPKRWAYAILVSPVGRLAVALVLSLPTAALALGSGAPIGDVGGLVLSTWIGAMGVNAGLGALKGKTATKSGAEP